jgi:SAM-dependent methyltransferase
VATPLDGSLGWDAYAPFYDWENARTMGRRDVAFWRRVALGEPGPLLELGCGTGRLLVPLARAGVRATGVDRSAPMLAYARTRAGRLPRHKRPALARGDIRALPFPQASFGVVLAPYGMLQSLLDDNDLDAALLEAARVLRPGGLLGIDLVPDLPRWDEYARRVQFRGRSGLARLALVESVRQDRQSGLTVFDEEWVVSRGPTSSRHRFSLTFRTRPIDEIAGRLARAGLAVETLLGGYDEQPWDRQSEVWLVVARRTTRAAPAC